MRKEAAKQIENGILKSVQKLPILAFKGYKYFAKYLSNKKIKIARNINTLISKIAYNHLNCDGLMKQYNVMSQGMECLQLKMRKN